MSSTFKGLLATRATIRSVLAKSYEVVAAEGWPPDERDPIRVMEENVRSSHILVLLLAPKRGTQITDSDLSMTENEYRTAEIAGVDVIPFIQRVGRAGARFVGRQRDFANEVKLHHFDAHGFASPKELPQMVLEAVDAWASRHPGCVELDVRPTSALNSQLARLLELGLPLERHQLADIESVVAGVAKSPRAVDPALLRGLEYLLKLIVHETAVGAELLPGLFELHAQEERWPEAFGDLEQLVRSGRISRDPSLAINAGTLLMTLGSYDDADNLLAFGEREAPGATDRAMARSIRFWIRDYQGRHRAVVSGSAAFLPVARDAGLAIAAGVRHRGARAMLALAARESGSTARVDQERALRELHRAWADQQAAGDYDNPYPAQWVYRAKVALGQRDRGKSFELAREMAERAGRAPRAHMDVLTGDRLAATSPIQAREAYEAAMYAWKELGYRKGVADVSLRLAAIVERLDGATHEALRWAFLALRLIEALKLANVREAQRLLTRIAGGPVTPERASELARELEELTYTNILRGFVLPRDLVWLPPRRQLLAFPSR